MKPLRYKTTLANLLIAIGAYYLSWWIIGPLSFAWGQLTQRIVYSGSFAGFVIMPLVVRAPVALVAAATGASVIYLVQSDQPMIWNLLLALLYALFQFVGHHNSHSALPIDWAFRIVGALFTALACIVGGIFAIRHLKNPSNTQKLA